MANLIQLLDSESEIVGLFQTDRDDLEQIEKDVDQAIIYAYEASPRGELEEYLLDQILEEYDLIRVFVNTIITERI